MNEENKDIINKFLLIGDIFMPEMHLWDPKVKKYSACGPFTRHQQRINDFMKDGYQRGLASIVYNFFDERTKGSGINNEKLAGELHKPIIKNFKRRKVYSSFKDNIWGVDLPDMPLISKFNKGVKYLFCVIDLFSRYSWVLKKRR